ncbi:hypothetical protein Taro_024427, partial [Colocasia esculenta]|nr:hypothetical protein [Colocasia esculenta]
MLQSQAKMLKKWSSSVDTRPSQVDTRGSSQRTMSTGLYSRSTPVAVRSTLETLPRRPVDTRSSQVDTRDLSQGSFSASPGQCVDTRPSQVDTLRKCNKPGHMKGECPENKKEKHKKIHKLKKPKAMVTTWSDEDSSENEEEEKSSSSESEEICFMANSSDGKARSTLPPSSVDTVKPRSTLTSSSVDTYPCQGDSGLGRWLGSSCICGALHLQNPFYMQGRPHGRLSPLKTATTPPSSLLQPILVLLPLIPSSPSSALPLPLASMAPKQAPRRGARSRATARPILVEEAPPSERRSKRRHDPAEQPEPSSTSPSSAKRGRTPSVRDNEKSQSILKSNIYCFKHVQKFMGFRLEGDQVRRGPIFVEAPVDPEAVIPPSEDQPPTNEDQPQATEDQPHILEEQPLAPEDQPQIEIELQLPQDAPLTPPFHTSSPTHPAKDTHTFTSQPQAQTSYAFGGPSVPPELYSFLNDKVDAFNTSIQHMTESFELKVQRLENTMPAKFIEEKAASDHAVQRFNRLIGTLADAPVELKDHQDKLEKVLQGILVNSQADVFNTKETLTQISKTRLSFAHLVDDLEGMKNLSAHIDSEMTDLKKELKNINKYGHGRTNISCKASVDTPLTGVDTMLQSQAKMLKKWSSSVDTRPSQVDTRGSSQRTMSIGLYSRSTPVAVRSTLESLPRRPVCQLSTAGRH